MARPALSDRKSERIQMVVAPEWIERVDDWAFERRIRSRSEAIRKLVDIALDPALSRHGEGK